MPKHPIRKICTLKIIGAIGVILLAARSSDVFAQQNPPADRPIRLGFSTTLFSGLNEADARAAVRTLTTTISKEQRISANPDPLITRTIGQAEEALRDGTIDAFGMTSDELWALSGRIPFDRFLFASSEGSSQETYLLLVNDKSQVRTLADLRGQRLILHSGARANLALPWLDLELAKAGLPASSEFLGSIAETTKATKTVLPVFFRQTDACLITRRSFSTVAEMNPQVGRALRVVAESQPCIPLIIAFRTGFPAPVKDKVIAEFCRLHTTAYGQQGLMIFQTQKINEHPFAFITPTLDLLDEHARLCPSASASRLSQLAKPREPAPN